MNAPPSGAIWRNLSVAFKKKKECIYSEKGCTMFAERKYAGNKSIVYLK